MSTDKDPDQGPVSATTVFGTGEMQGVADPRIRMLLADLPVLPEMHNQINRAAAGLTGIIVIYGSRRFLPPEQTGTRIALKELSAVSRTAARFEKQLSQLHKEPYDLLHAKMAEERLYLSPQTSGLHWERYRLNHPIEHLKSETSQLRLAADVAYFILDGRDMVPAPRGAPQKLEAAAITNATANCFEGLTGIRIKRSIDRVTGEPQGSFHQLLTAIFKLAGITVNVDEQIKGQLRKGQDPKKSTDSSDSHPKKHN